MSLLFVDDATKSNELARLTTSKMSKLVDIVSSNDQYLVYYDDAIKVVAPLIVAIGSSIFNITEDAILTVANIDGSVLAAGRDYYVYVCDAGNNQETFKISLNSTYPNGFDANTSRKIGGFHYGNTRKVSSNLIPINSLSTEWGTGWEDNVKTSYVPRSVWTLLHRPICPPEGMVYIGGGVWVDIYQASDDGSGGFISVSGAEPYAAHMHSENWYDLNDRVLCSDKRFITYAEWCKVAFGTPDGNGLTLSASDDTGKDPKNVSIVGCCDCVGHGDQYTNEIMYHPNTEQIQWFNYPVLNKTVTGRSPVLAGSAYLPQLQSVSAILCGGNGNNYDRQNNGSRTTKCSSIPWYINTATVRLGCNSL